MLRHARDTSYPSISVLCNGGHESAAGPGFLSTLVWSTVTQPRFAELRSDVSDRGSTTTSAVALYGCCEELGLELELLDMAVVASSCRGRLTLMLGRCSSSPPPPSTTLALSCPSLLLSVVCCWSGRAQHRIRHRSSAVNMAAVDVGAFACSQDRFDVLCCSS